MNDSKKFLYQDKGKKTETIAFCAQPELQYALLRLVGPTGSMSTYCRQVLITHVRKQIREGKLQLQEVKNGRG